ncbi:MAG: hypothetical protein OXG81_02990 [Acidobacteria bacterium]|nr:hypothetical protein [Acidobacteriota bacterium]
MLSTCWRSRPDGRRVYLAACGGGRRGRRRTQWATSSPCGHYPGISTTRYSPSRVTG